MRTIFLTIVAFLLSCTTALAVTFNFAGPNIVAPSHTFTNGSLSVETTAGTFDNSGVITPGGLVGRYGGGLGTTTHPFDSHEVDGATRNDLVIFDFNQTVILESVTFSLVDSNDEFSFFFDNEPDGTLDPISFNVNIPGIGIGTYNFVSTWEGSLFGIGAYDGSFRHGIDNFKIKSMTVSVVPLPATLPLYAAGLALLAFFGRRRKR